MIEAEKHFVIINPVSGNGKALDDWELIQAILRKNRLLFTYHFSAREADITEVVKAKIEAGYRSIIVVGGDGSLNEAVNGIFFQQAVSTNELTLGIIPVGTGNDFCRTHKIPFNYNKAIEIIAAGKKVVHDVGLIEFDFLPPKYFINIAGCGYDGFVASKIIKLPAFKKSNKAIYLFEVVKNLFAYKPVEIKATVYGSVLYEGKIFSMAIANCKYNGGGMMQAPDAVFNDGLLNVTLIKPRSLLKIIFNMYRLFNGTITAHSMVFSAKVSALEVVCGTDNFLEADGESVGQGSFKIKILPGYLNVFSGLG